MLEYRSPSAIADELTRLYATGLPPGDSMGWKSTNPLYTIAPGYWTAITGIPSEGKSTFVDNLMVNLMKRQWRFVVFSAETQPLPVYLSGVLETLMRKPFRQGYVNRMEPSDIARAVSWLDERLIMCNASDDDTTGFRLPSINSLMGVAEDMISKDWKDHGKVGVILDPWNEMDHTPISGMNETQMTNHELALWRQWIRKMKVVHGFIVAHPSKPQKDREGNFKPVTLYDISGSSAWKNKADGGIVIRRPFDGQMEVDVEKCRLRHLGKAGKTFLRFNWGYNYLYETDDREETTRIASDASSS
jgi:twinkle protein